MNWGVLAVAVLTFLTAVIGYLSTRKKIAEVHVLVNSQLHEVLDRVTVLTSALDKAGVEVPPETAKPPAGGGAGA